MDDKHLERFVEVEQRGKSNTKRLDEHDERLEKLEKNTAILEKMDYRMGRVENAVERIDNKLEAHQEKKGVKWDKLIDYLFYAMLAYALFKLGLK